ncbi:MAG: DUF6790 family protein [Pseudorhodoplanes sp.]|uniref:DUF6790 family protein n=1 Tax=Pseudorhodoplanes sp. TaxID=1934341 RepID=UPI003D0CA8AE
MQIVVILVLMVAAPVAAIVIQGATTGGSLIALAGTWFVFFFGLRLLIAGFHQLAKPDFTAKTIFRITDPNAAKIVSELGFGNIAIGALGVLTLFNANWIVPAAIVMAIFYALAGGKHVMNAQRTASENWAMGSDVWAALVLAGWLVVVWMER